MGIQKSSRFGLKSVLTGSLLAASLATGCADVPEAGEFDDDSVEVDSVEQAIEPNSSVVISQIFADGQNKAGAYTQDFIEILNRGDHDVNITGWSVQYASATGNGKLGSTASMLTPLPAMTLKAGQYLLVGGYGGAIDLVRKALPTPFVMDTSPIDLSRFGGKVALVKNATPVGCNGGSYPCTAAQLATIVDLVGYGSANFYEGNAAAPLPIPQGLLRQRNGCWDSNSSSFDWVMKEPVPHTQSMPVNLCFNFGTSP